jgi:hypothetical protein
MKRHHQLLAFGIALCLFQSAQATLFYTEGFNYTSGPLGGNDSWIGASGQLQVGSANLTYSGLADAANPGNDLLVNQGAAGSMTVNFNGSAITSGSIYYSFLAEATTLPTANSYLTDLLPTGGSPNGSGDPLSVYVGQQVAGSQFRIGVRHSGAGSGATYTTSPLFTAGAVNLFVVEYTFVPGTANDTVSLFVNPTPGGSQPTADVTLSAAGTDAANLQAIGFKANSGTTAGNWIFDTLRVGDTWADVTPALIPEPSAVALLGFGILGLALWRRVRR